MDMTYDVCHVPCTKYVDIGSNPYRTNTERPQPNANDGGCVVACRRGTVYSVNIVDRLVSRVQPVQLRSEERRPSAVGADYGSSADSSSFMSSMVPLISIMLPATTSCRSNIPLAEARHMPSRHFSALSF